MSGQKRSTALRLGSNVVELILPHRRPLLMVDEVTAYAGSPVPTLDACKHVSANEIFFEGHFPGLHLWPGCLTIEGMGQACAILDAIDAMRRGFVEAGHHADEVLSALRNIECGYRMEPGFHEADARQFLAILGQQKRSIAIGAAVNVKLHKPVFAGQRIDYHVSIVRNMDPMMRFDVEASVDGAAVASGTMTGARWSRFTPAEG